MTTWLADTSVAIPLVQAAHAAHTHVNDVVGDRSVGLPAHAALETYSVLTRLPGDARLTPTDAATLIAARFGHIAAIDVAAQLGLVGQLAAAHVAGGATYDALIGITASGHGATLLTRDTRAAATYTALDITYELIV